MYTSARESLGILMIVAVVVLPAHAAVDLTLDYTASAGVTAHAAVGHLSSGDPDDPSTWMDLQETGQSDVKSLRNGTLSVNTRAEAQLYSHDEPGPMLEDPPVPRFHTQWADASASVGVELVGGTEVRFCSSIVRDDGNMLYGGDAVGLGTSGGLTRLTGTLEIGTDDAGGYPDGTPLSLLFSSVIGGDPSYPEWEWWVKVERGDDLIATLNSTSPSLNVDVYAGETLDYELFHAPEPATAVLLACGTGLLLRRRRR